MSHDLMHHADMPAPQTSLWLACDRAADGNLASWLAEHRSNGESHEDIIGGLRKDFGVRVTRETLARWLKTLGVDVAAPLDAA